VRSRSLAAALLAVLALAAGCARGDGGETETAPPPGSQQLPNPDGYVALTFDDGPDPELTPQLLDTLQAYDAPATFFVEGANVRAYPEIVRREADEEHEVGNHTYDHANLLSLDDEQVWRQIRGTSEALEEIGVVPVLFRPPFGARDERIDAIVREEGLTMTMWSYSADPRDWEAPGDEGKPAAEVCEAVVERARDGDLILLHDRLRGTVEAVPCIIRGLRERGLEPGRVVRSGKPSEQNDGSLVTVVP
jgi:peptidoglycan/xylan/chitin deacetylase (PgdA/CDA1 family)